MQSSHHGLGPVLCINASTQTHYGTNPLSLQCKAILPPSDHITYVADMNSAPEGCDAVVIATEWPEFKKLDLERARKAMTHPIMFDGRNLFDPQEMERLGYIYKSIGR